MRSNFMNAFSSLPDLGSRDFLGQSAESAQEMLVQTLGNLQLLHEGEEIGGIREVMKQYDGAYSNTILSLKYVSYCMEREMNNQYVNFPILTLLSKWIEVLEQVKKKKDVRLYPTIIQSTDLNLITFEQFIVYLNFISLDLFLLIKSGTEESRKKYNEQTNHPHLDVNDLLKVIKVILPKVLVNIRVPRSYFPPTLLKTEQQLVEILYSNQCLQNIVCSKQHYLVLIKIILKILLPMQMEPTQLKQLILASFNYYLLFHRDKANGASQIVIESLKKITTAVRFAINDEILQFLITLRKLGKQLFVSYITEKFEWIEEGLREDCCVSVSKETLNPFRHQTIGKSFHIKIEPRKIQRKYVQIYDRYSLLYFCLKCIDCDITIRFFYLGDFNMVKQEKKELFSSEKRSGVLSGSIETIEAGIYMFELDNSYSWIKSKVVAYEIVVLVPLEVRKQEAGSTIKSIVFEKYSQLNQVPSENVLGWVDYVDTPENATVIDVKKVKDNSIVTLNLRLTYNHGMVYEYETQSLYRFIHKLISLGQNSHVCWHINGNRIAGFKEVQSWLHSDLNPPKVSTAEPAMQTNQHQSLQSQSIQPQSKNEQIPTEVEINTEHESQEHKSNKEQPIETQQYELTEN